MTQPTPEACQAIHEAQELHQASVISLPGKWCWRCQCGAERTPADAVKGDVGWEQCADELHGHVEYAVLDAVWPIADEFGYRRAVQALRDEAAASVIFESSRLNDHESAVVAKALAEHLETLAAAAPHNEGAQT